MIEHPQNEIGALTDKERLDLFRATKENERKLAAWRADRDRALRNGGGTGGTCITARRGV